MFRVINAILLVLPVTLFLYEYLKYFIYSSEDDSYDNFFEYLENKTELDEVIFWDICIFFVTVILNITISLMSYNYQVIRHYTSDEFIITSLVILIIFASLIVFNIGGSRFFLAVKSKKLQKKIESTDNRIKVIKNIDMPNEKKENSLKILYELKEKYTNQLVFITTSYQCDKNEKKEIKKRLFEE